MNRDIEYSSINISTIYSNTDMSCDCSTNDFKKDWDDWNKTGKFLQKSMQYERALIFFQENLDLNRYYTNDEDAELMSTENIASVLDDLERFDEAIHHYRKLLEHENVAKHIQRKFRILLCIENVYHRKGNKIENRKLDPKDSESLQLIQREISELGLKFDDVFKNRGDRVAIYQDLKHFDEVLIIQGSIQKGQNQNDLKASFESYLEIGFSYLNLKNYFDAIPNFEEARRLSYLIDENESRMWICFNLYQCYRELNLIQYAVCFLIHILKSSSEYQNFIVKCLVYEEYSKLFLDLGVNHEAEKYAKLHYYIAKEMQSEFEMNRAQEMLDNIRKENDEHNFSVSQALGIEDTIENAIISYEAGDYDEAIDLLEIVDTILSLHTDIKLRSIVFDWLGTVFYSKAEQMKRSSPAENNSEQIISIYKSAVYYFDECLKFKEHVQRPKHIYKTLADIHFNLKDYNHAIENYRLLFSVAFGTNDAPMACEALKSIGVSCIQLYKFDLAFYFFTRASEMAAAFSFTNQDFHTQINKLLAGVNPSLGA